ncbi:MAG: OsmC family protein [Planctomycetota bacterium]|jgi:putative redox protein
MSLITIERRSGGSEFVIRVRKHEVTADMSEKDGGHDGGPSPVDLITGALGACIGMMVQKYCDTHGWKDGEVGVGMTIEMADDPKRVGTVTIDLEIPKDVPEDRRAAVKRVAELCPVHATLTRGPKIDIEIV